MNPQAKPSVLLVEDEENLHETLKMNLELEGYDVTSAFDGAAALKAVENEYFDLIIMDPPTFSNSKRMDDFLDVQRDHVTLINNGLRILSPAGLLFFSTNYTRFMIDEEQIRGRVKNITAATTPFDFAGKLKRQCYKISRNN